MVKPTTPQVVRFSPVVAVHRSPPKSTGNFSYTNPGNARRGTRFTSKGRVEATRNEDKDYLDGDVSTMYRELDRIACDDSGNASRRITKDEGNLLDWDEESTLAAMFEDQDMDVDDREELAALAEQLRGPMNAQAQRLRQHLKGTIIPAIQQIKLVHDKMEDEVDMSFGKGVLAFDDACKRAEVKALQDEDAIRDAYNRMQHNMGKLVDQLKDAHERRERLWAKFEDDLEQCAVSAKAALEAIPTEMEDTIAKLERKNKNMEKKSNDTAAKRKMLKGLLDKL